MDVGDVCDDSDVCTVDMCDTSTGACTHEPAQCPDGEPCTVAACDPAAGCTYGPDPCDDGLVCTDDSCDLAEGCVHTAVDCDDSDVCTTDSCQEGGLECPFGEQDGDSCYAAYQVEEPISWIDAHTACEGLGGHLVSIHSEAENDFVWGLAQTDCSNNPWIGFTDELVEGSFGWITAEDVTYTNWNTNEPNDSGEGEDYAVMRRSDGKWNDANINVRCYICEASLLGGCYASDETDCDDGDPCTTDACDPVSGECSHTFDAAGSCTSSDLCLQGTCSLVETSPTSCSELGWVGGFGTADVCADSLAIIDPATGQPGCQSGSLSEALDMCAATGARLCTLNELIAQEARGTGCGYDADLTWTSSECEGGAYVRLGSGIGETQCAAAADVLAVRCCADADVAALVTSCEPIAATDCDDGDLCTYDGCTGDVGCEHADIACGDGDHCTLDFCDPSDGSCGSELACDDESACTDDACLFGACPFGQQLGDSCYLGVQAPGNITWDEARAECDALGGDLASISTAVEQLLVHGALPSTCADDFVWMGLNDVDAEGYLAWSNGDALEYTQWGNNQPSSFDWATIRPSNGNWIMRNGGVDCYVCEASPALDACENLDIDCSDGQDCTVDDCEPVGGCTNEFPCDDGDTCTHEYCNEAGCQSAPLDEPCCSAGGTCSNDDCYDCVLDNAVGCIFGWSASCAETAAGVCDDVCACTQLPSECDGDLCTTSDSCVAGACQPGLAADCPSDDNECTADCDPSTGECGTFSELPALGAGACCAEAEIGDSGCSDTGCESCVCDQDSFCCNNTWDEWCFDCAMGGTGFQGNSCEAGSCADACGCEVACDDGSDCTGDGHCLAGGCVGGVIDCDDGDDCTLDSCDGAACVHGPPDVVVACPEPLDIATGDAAEWTFDLLGVATLTDAPVALQLTPDTAWSNGAAWSQDKMYVRDGFTASITMTIETAGNNAGDGMAFVVQNLGNDQVGDHKGVHGADLAIAIDTYPNSGDTGNEVDLYVGGELIATAPWPVDFENTTFEVGVVLSSDSLVDVSINGEPLLVDVPVEVAGVGASAAIYDGNGEAWVGFTGRTAQAFEAHIVEALTFESTCTNTTCDGSATCTGGICVTQTTSELSCDDLGWTNAAKEGDASICGESDIPGCVTATWSEAQTACEAIGARLCTIEEVLADEAASTGCGFNADRIWSSTRCASGGAFSAAGDSAWLATFPVECTAPGQDLAVRCCAEVAGFAPSVVCQGETSETCDDGDDCTIDTCEYGAGCQSADAATCVAAGDGGCCSSNLIGSCDDAACATCVCDADETCCSVSWDELCSDLAQGACWLNCGCAE